MAGTAGRIAVAYGMANRDELEFYSHEMMYVQDSAPFLRQG